MRIFFGFIISVYLIFLAVLLFGTGRWGGSTAFGIFLFTIFGLALIAHIIVPILHRSWIYAFFAAASASVLCVIFVWVLHKATGDSL